jgi:oligoendopeptidase F
LVDGGVAIVGDEADIEQLQEQIKKAAKQSGQQIGESGKLQKKKGRKTKKINSYIPVDVEPTYKISTNENIEFVEESVIEKVKPTQVYFENAFGKIRSAVEKVIEHDLAFMLLFSSEDEIVFEPKVSETLDFTYNKVSYSVYYPGVIFDWTDGVKKAMILFKVPKKDE